jgi:hypothetical protein
MHTPSGLGKSLIGSMNYEEGSMKIEGKKKLRNSSFIIHPFASSALRHLLFAIWETSAVSNSPESGRQYLRDTFGQGYWGRRERFIALLEWLAALGNAVGMSEWITDSEAARILAGRLRNDQA